MGFGGISIPSLLIILAIIILLFGTKRLKNFGSDLGSAIKGFKDSVSNEDKTLENKAEQTKDADFAETKQKEANKD